MNNLWEICLDNLNRIIFAHVNINFLRNKSELLFEQVKGMVDSLIYSEPKLDKFFLAGQFKIPGYVSSFWLDRNQFDEGILVFIREDILSELLTSDFYLWILYLVKSIFGRRNGFFVTHLIQIEITYTTIYVYLRETYIYLLWNIKTF